MRHRPVRRGTGRARSTSTVSKRSRMRNTKIAEHDEGDQHRERDADLDHQRHAAGAGGGQDQAVLQRHEADHLADGVAPGDHHQQAEQDHGEREARCPRAPARRRCGGDRQHHHGSTARPGRGRPAWSRPTPTTCLDLAVDAELHAPSGAAPSGSRCALKTSAISGGDVEMRRVLDLGLPGDRQRQHERLQREALSSANMRSW